MPQFDWILIKCVLYLCVMSPTSDIYIDLGLLTTIKNLNCD